MCVSRSYAAGLHTRPAPRGWLAALRRCLPLRVLGWLSLPLFPLFCMFVMDGMSYSVKHPAEQMEGYRDVLLERWEERPGGIWFEVLVVLLLFCVLTLVLRRAWASGLIFGVLSFACAYVNYMKVALNGDYFYPQDLAMASQAGELASFVSGGVPDWFWYRAAAAIVWILLFWLLSIDLPRPFFWRWSAAALLVLSAHIATCTSERSEQLLNRFEISHLNAAIQSSNYELNGFVGAFTINALSMRVGAPAGYDEQTIQELLAPYSAVPADPDAEQFDVVVVLSESFFDARILPGASFSENPLANYDRLRESPYCFSGMMYSTAIGGGTVRPEFAVLTGLTTDRLPVATTPYWFISEDVPSYVSLFKDAGYGAIAVHPYNAEFYSRDTAYPHLGFDAFFSEPDMYDMTPIYGIRGYVEDRAVALIMEGLVDWEEGPTFLFTITMENHQPYDALEESGIRIQVDCPALSETSHTALTTYTQGLYDADQMLGELARWIDERERPTVLLFFGDHMPTLGANYLAYHETGFINSSDDSFSSEELLKMYRTPFLIYSNRELDGGLLSSHTGNEISDYNLMNSVMRSIGMARTPYMELLADFYDTAPYYNDRLWLPKNEDVDRFAKAMELITYDRILGKGWSK